MSPDIEEKLKNTGCIVEATHAEQHMLWCLHAKQSPYSWTDCPADSKVDWVEESRGFIEQIGTLADMPVSLSGFWAIINGKRVLFIEMTSQVCDYRMLKPWLQENCPNATVTTNATNFGHIR
jgi:hypothetical protein